MKLFVYAAALAMLFGCVEHPGHGEHKPKPAHALVADKFLTYDGCPVHRYVDYGYPIYYTTCTGKTEWVRSCGEGCTRSVVVASLENLISRN